MNIPTSTEKDALTKMHREEREPVRMSGALSNAHSRTKASRTPQSKSVERLLSILPPLVLAFLFLASWYLGTTYGHINALFLPSLAAMFASLSDGISSGLFLKNAFVTIQESVSGFLLALAIALPLGYGLVKSRFLAFTLHPYLAAGQAIPAIVIAPVLIIWLGYGAVPNMLVCMLVVLFPMVMNTILGLQTIDQALTDAARVEGAAGWSLLANIEFPLALPSILTGVRTGFTLSITGALVAEFVQGGDQGLGSLLLVAKNQLNTPFMFATLVVLAGLAALYYAITWLLARVAEAAY